MAGSLAEGQAQAARQAGEQERGLEFEVCSLFSNHREAQRLQMSVRPSVCVKCASGLTVNLSYMYMCILGPNLIFVHGLVKFVPAVARIVCPDLLESC